MDYLLNYKIFESIKTARETYDLSDEQVNQLKKLNMKPIMVDVFAKYLMDGESIDQIKNTYKLYLRYRQLFKDQKITVEDFPKLEDLYDFIQEKVNNQRVEKTIKQLPSGTRKYVTKKLYELLRNNLDVLDEVRSFYSRKGGNDSYKSEESLYDATENKIKSLLGDWNPDRIKKKMKGLNADIIYEDAENIILEIKDFQTSNKLGSQDWCLVTDEGHWEDYYNDGINRIYFIYDFTKSIESPYSMIEISIEPNGQVSEAWDKQDNPIEDKSIYKDFLPHLKPIPKEELKQKIDMEFPVELLRYGLVDEFKERYHTYNEGQKNSALDMAAKKGYVEILKLLVEDGVDPSINMNSALSEAVFHGQTEAVKFLLKDNRVDPKENSSNIIDACTKGYVDIVRVLLEDNRIDPSVSNNMAIRNASLRGHDKIVEILLQDERVDPSVSDNIALQDSVRRGFTRTTKLLLQDERVNPNINLWRPMEHAIDNGYDEIAEALMNHKRFKLDDHHKISFVSRCILKGRLEILKMLLEKTDAEVTFYSNNAFKEAVYKGYYDMVKFLVEENYIDPSELITLDTLNFLSNEKGKNYKKLLNLFINDERMKNVVNYSKFYYGG